ncbi:radical SAM protein [Fusobacteria bacterium ZRK30]|nr:radical SAM protein [Fusobacteria bacterium ZRK30]
MLNSIFNIPFHNGKYIFNSKNGGIVELPKDNKFKDEEIAYLKEHDFIVENNEKEVEELLNETLEFINRDIETLEITIQLTEECNFSCVYCYQEKKIKEITFDKANSILGTFRKILSVHKINTINVHYFGGEPLLKKDMIYYLDLNLKKMAKVYNLKYHAYLTTNGYFLDEKLLKNIEFEKIKITIEGLKQTHNMLRKSESPNFDIIMKNIENTILYIKKLEIRINLCGENIDEFEKLVDLIYTKFDKTRNKIKIDISHMLKYNPTDKFTQLSLEEFSKFNLFARKKYKKKVLNC